MNTTEQIIENVRALLLSEKQKIFDFVEEEKLKVLSEKEAKNIELEIKNERFRRALQWIEDHKEEFDGQWVVLDGDKLIAHGKDAKSVYEKAKAKGIGTPFMERVKAKELPFGGW